MNIYVKSARYPTRYEQLQNMAVKVLFRRHKVLVALAALGVSLSLIGAMGLIIALGPGPMSGWLASGLMTAGYVVPVLLLEHRLREIVAEGPEMFRQLRFDDVQKFAMQGLRRFALLYAAFGVAGLVVYSHTLPTIQSNVHLGGYGIFLAWVLTYLLAAWGAITLSKLVFYYLDYRMAKKWGIANENGGENGGTTD